MYTALIFKEQSRVPGIRGKGLSQLHDSMQSIEGHDVLFYKEKSTFLSSKKEITFLIS
jgi:hypothetical protein